MRYIETYEVRRMTHSQESRVSSSQDTVPPREENRSNMSAMVNDINSCLRGDMVSNNNLLKVEKMAATSNEDGKNSDSVNPWLSSWKESCHQALVGKTTRKLDNLMKKFLGYVSSNVKECYTRPNRAAKLRKCIDETLNYFHLYYKDVRQFGKHSSYLNVMCELASMYVDMEIKAASRRKERVKKITARICASITLFLDKSNDHVLDAILKAKLITKHNRDICLPVLGKIVSHVPLPLNELSYIRYLLIFKLYKKVAQNAEKSKQQKAEEGRRINKLAVLKLKPPPNFVEKAKMFTNVLPKIPPKSKKNITHFFMQAKFNLRSACTAFIKSASEFHTMLNGSASKEASYSKSASVDFASKLEYDAGASNSSANDIWSSIELKSLIESFPLRNLNSEKTDLIGISKKVKEKVKKKNKKNKGMKSKEKDIEKIRKKKLKKNKILDSCGDTEPILQNKLLDSKKDKGKKRCLKNDVAIMSCESTDESVSLPEVSPTADSMNKDLGVLSNLSSKGLKNLLTGPGSSYSSESQKVGSTGVVLKQEKGNEKEASDVIEVTAETSVSVSGCEHSSSTATLVPTFNSRSSICTVTPPPSHPYSSGPLPLSHTPPTHKMPSTSSSQVGSHSYLVQHHSSSHSDHTSHHPKRNSESLTSSPTKSSVHTSNSPHVSTCSSLPSPHRSLPNICSGLPAGFTPSVPPPPLGHPPPQHNMKSSCLDCYNNQMYLPGTHSMRYLEHPDVSASFQPPLPSSPAPLRPPLPRSPAPPLPPLPSTPAPSSSVFPMHSMSVPPPSLALFSTIPPPPPPPPPGHSHHISGHPSLSVRPGHTLPSHLPPVHIQATHPPQPTPPSVCPPPTPSSIPPPPPAPLATSTYSSPPFHYSQFSSLSVSHPSSTQVPSTSTLISSASSLNANSRNPPVIPLNVPSVNPPISHTPPPRSRSISSPSPCTPSYAPTPPLSCTATPPSPSCTPPSSPLYSHTRISHSPSLTPSSTPPLHSANFPSHSSHSRPTHSSALLSPSLTPTPPPPSIHPSNSPSPSHSPTQRSVTPPLSLHPSTVPSQSSTNVSTSAARSLVVTLPSSNISSQSISPSSPSQSCAVVFSTYTPASPSPSPSLCCSVSPSPSRSPSPCHSPSPSRSPSPSQSSFHRSPSVCRSSSPRSLSPSRSRTPPSSPISRSQSPSTSLSPSYTPVCLSPHTPNPSPLCIPTPSSPLRNSITPTSCTTISSVQPSSVNPSVPSSVNSPVSKQSKPTESSSSSSPVQSPVHARSNTPVPHASLACTSSLSSVSNTVRVTTVTCTIITASVPTSTLSSRASSSPVPSSSSPICVTISSKSPSCSPIPSDVSSQTEVKENLAMNVTLSTASPSQTPSPVSPLAPSIPTPCIVEQPTTTTLILDSPAKVTQSSVELHGTQNDNKSKGPCDSSPAVLDPAPIIPCFTSSVASSEDRIEEVVAEVEVQAEDTETEVEADTLVSQVVEESQESVLTGTNSEQPVSEEVNERLSKMKVSCDSAGESMFLVEAEEVYSDECEEVEPDMCIKEKMFEERYSHVNSVIAPVGQMRNTVIASGGTSGSAENTKYLVTSQICKTEVQENEAVASCSVSEKVCLNAVSPRLDSDPLLVSRPMPNDSESKTVAYTCDSSIPSVSLIEGCSPANNEDLFQIPMDIGNLEETTSFVPGAARNDELLNEVITGNHLLFSLQNGFSIMALDVSARQEDPEPDSPAVEEFDERDRASISNLMMYFSGVHTADFSDFGRGRQDYVVPRDILESDDIEEEAEDTSALSSDPHDKSFNTSNNSVVDLDNHEYSRRHTKGGKHPAPGLAPRRYIDDLEERDGSDASPSSNVENDSIFSQNTLFSNDCIESRRERHCHVPESPKMNALGEVHIPRSSTPKRLPDVNFIRSMPNALDSREDSSPEESPVKVSDSSSSALSRAHLLANRTVEVRLNRDSVPGIIPDVVLDAHKAEGQREQEAPKAAPRGMLLDTNVTRGKLGRPYVDTTYHGIPLQAGSIPSSIPYPPINQVANGKGAPPVQNVFNCTCTQCCANHILMLSGYDINAGVTPIPLSFHHTHLDTHTDKLKSAEKLKSEDEELLRRIEESLAQNKLDEILVSKYKPELDSSLPLKKRLKTMTAMSKIKSEPTDKWDNLKEDSFPSYPTKPMISIAELEYNAKLFSKHIQRPIKTVMSNNPQRYLPYAYFQHLQQGKEVNKFENESPQYSQYNAEVSSTINVPYGNIGREVPLYQFCPVNRESPTEKNSKLQQSMQQLYFNPTSVTTTITNTISTIKTTNTINNNHLNKDKNKSSDLKKVTVKVESFPEIKVEPSLIQQNPIVSSWEYSGRQFKTPGQLKELPAVNYYMGMPVMKYNGSKSELNPPPNTRMCVPKLNSIDEIKYGFSQYNKSHALDLSVEDPGSVKGQRNRSRKSNSAGDSTSRPRSSKRNSKNQGVCQSSTTPNVYYAAEKKMHRKQVSR